jgi:hypothetical protein
MKREINIIKNIILIISGCFLMAFTEPLEGNKGKARIIFMNERAFWGDKVEVIINNKKIIDLHSNYYTEVELDADDVEIIIDRDNNMAKKGKPDVQANLTVEPDKIYYLKIYREIDYFTNKLYLVRISEQTAKQAIKSMKLEKTPLKNE